MKKIHICSWPKRIGKSSEVAKSNNNFLALSYFVYKWNDNPCNIYSHKSSNSDISSSNSSSNNKNRNIDDRTTRIWNYRVKTAHIPANWTQIRLPETRAYKTWANSWIIHAHASVCHLIQNENRHKIFGNTRAR